MSALLAGSRVLVFAGLALVTVLEVDWIDRLASAQLEQSRRLLQRSAEEIAAELDSAAAAAPDDAARADVAAELLPSIAASVLGEHALDEHAFAIVAPEGTEELYRSGPDVVPEVDVPVFRSGARWARFQGDETDTAPEMLELQESRSGWRLQVGLRGGTLADRAAASRARNLALGIGALALLAAGSVWSFLAERRARALAEREIAFVASVSHELRTPLAVIRSAAANLSDGIVPAERVRDYADLIRGETQRMGAQVEKVLAFASARRDAAPHRARVALATLLEESRAEACLRCAAPTEGVEVDAPRGAELHADPELVRAALVNLLENALRHGRPPVRLAARVEGGAVVLTVEDRGPGLAPEDEQRAFEPFHRGAEARRLALPGCGLGLAIVAEVARAHGGDVSHHRADGGACFRLRIPDRPEEARA